jgi:hypothetical protein
VETPKTTTTTSSTPNKQQQQPDNDEENPPMTVSTKPMTNIDSKAQKMFKQERTMEGSNEIKRYNY